MARALKKSLYERSGFFNAALRMTLNVVGYLQVLGVDMLLVRSNGLFDEGLIVLW